MQSQESWRNCTHFQQDSRTGIGISPVCPFLCLLCPGEYTGGFSIPVLQLYVGDGGIKRVTCLIS